MNNFISFWCDNRHLWNCNYCKFWVHFVQTLLLFAKDVADHSVQQGASRGLLDPVKVLFLINTFLVNALEGIVILDFTKKLLSLVIDFLLMIDEVLNVAKLVLRLLLDSLADHCQSFITVEVFGLPALNLSLILLANLGIVQ